MQGQWGNALRSYQGKIRIKFDKQEKCAIQHLTYSLLLAEKSADFVLANINATTNITLAQGWEFAHRISERNARFYQKVSHSLLCSILGSDLSNSLTVAHLS